jgi:plasmid maintenance system killer protein
MIVSFKNTETEDIFNGASTKATRKLCPESIWRVATRKLDQIDSVISVEELSVPPGNRLDKLTGDRAKSAVLGFPRLVLTHTTWRKPPGRASLTHLF